MSTFEPEYNVNDELPRRIGESLDAVARRLGAPTATSMGALFTRWDEAVGPTIAAHARPVGLADGVLTVAVDEPGWATELKYLRNDLVRRLATIAGPGIVGRIELRVDPSLGSRNPRSEGPR